jgi:hypothetical protein
MNTQDSLQLIGLVVTALSSLTPLKDLPILEYSDVVTTKTADPKIDVISLVISNYGMGPAKNVLASITANNVTFLNFSSEPYLSSKYFKPENLTVNYSKHGFFEIDTLPSGAQLVVKGYANISAASEPTEFDVKVFSDKVIGYGSWHKDLIVHLVIGFLIVATGLLLAIRYYYYYHRRNIERVA